MQAPYRGVFMILPPRCKKASERQGACRGLGFAHPHSAQPGQAALQVEPGSPVRARDALGWGPDIHGRIPYLSDIGTHICPT